MSRIHNFFEPCQIIILMLNSCSALNFQQFDLYILDTFGEILWLRVLSNSQECEKFSGRCYARTSKNFSKYGQYIYIKLLDLYLVLSTNLALNDDLTLFKEVIDVGFRRILSNVVIFGWSVINDQFLTLLMVKNICIYHILNLLKYCYKLSNKHICMLFNILKQLKLVEIEGHI